MRSRALSLAGPLALAASAASGAPVSLSVVHDPPACVLAARRPRLVACITPASQVARAQVSFRTADGAAPLTAPLFSDAPCFSAVLPRLGPEAAELRYAIEATDRLTGVVVRSSEYRARVVADAAACGGGRVAAVGSEARPATSRSGAAGPAGAEGGGGGGKKVVLAVLGGGAAIAGGVIAAAGGQAAEPSPAAPPTTDPAVAATPFPLNTPPIPSPTPEVSPAPRQPRNPTPPPGPLPPAPTGPQPAPAPTPTPAPQPTPAPNDCSADRASPSTRITGPTGTLTVRTVTITASASDNVGVTRLEFYYHVDSQGVRAAADPPRLIGSVRRPPWQIQFGLPSVCGDVLAFSSRAYDDCGNVGISGDQRVTVCTTANVAGAQAVPWASTLEAGAAEGQIVVNGTSVVFVPAGPSTGMLAVEGSDMRVEAQLVRAGAPGTWRIDLPGGAGRRLRVLAGDVVATEENAVRFRVRGQAGERVVFTVGLDAPPSP